MICRISLACLVLSTGLLNAEDALKEGLEQCYQSWRGAIIGRNEVVWRKVTAAHRQMEVRNRILSEKKRFPQAVFDLPSPPPALDGLKFLTTKRAGPTARLYYFGAVDFGGAKSQDSLLVVSFVGGGDSWFYDHAEFINLVALPDVRTELAMGNLSYIDQTPELQPSGIMPTTAMPVAEAAVIAKVYVFCPGRKVQVQVNQVSRHSFSNDKEAELIIGGARLGANDVQYAIEDLPGSSGADPLAVRVYLLSQTPGVTPIKIFEYLVEGGSQPVGFGKGSFVVDAAVLGNLSARADR